MTLPLEEDKICDAVTIRLSGVMALMLDSYGGRTWPRFFRANLYNLFTEGLNERSYEVIESSLP
jgi:hypothetical protein